MSIDRPQFKSNQIAATPSATNTPPAKGEDYNIQLDGQNPYDYTSKLGQLLDGKQQSTIMAEDPDPTQSISWTPDDLFAASLPTGKAATQTVRDISVPTLNEILATNPSNDLHLGAIEARYVRLIDGLAVMKQNWIFSLPHMAPTEFEFANGRIQEIDDATTKAKQYLGQVRAMIKNSGQLGE